MAEDAGRSSPSLVACIAPSGRTSIQWLLALRTRELESQNVLAVVVDAAETANEIGIAPIDSRLGEFQHPGALQWQLQSEEQIRVQEAIVLELLLDLRREEERSLARPEDVHTSDSDLVAFVV